MPAKRKTTGRRAQPSASDPGVTFRCASLEEYKAITRARDASGLSAVAWARAVAEAGMGESEVLTALERAQAAGEALDHG